MRGQLDPQNTHARTHKEEKEEEEEDARRRRMSRDAAEERERQKREELSMIGALPPITPQKKGEKRFALENTRKASIALSLSEYTSNEV
jgi:hypothetical protein|tara:strand:+ start:587 stop:853 length:267 start_codon:yes stop_codon:yes gene_type:complete